MRSWKRLAQLGIFLALAGCGAGGSVPWADSVADARAKAASANSLVMMEFYADW